MLSVYGGLRYSLLSVCRRSIFTTRPQYSEKLDNEIGSEDKVEAVVSDETKDEEAGTAEEGIETGFKDEAAQETILNKEPIDFIELDTSSESNDIPVAEPVLQREPIGFIGLGNMGTPMGMNLLKNGHKLIVYDISSKAMEPFKNEDVIIASSPEEVAQQVSKIITVLPSSEDVMEVYRGNRGVFNQLRPGSILIDSSTIDPALAKEINTAAAAYDSVYIDAPVSGGVDAAVRCTLTFMCGGTTENFLRVEELLLRMGKEVVHCGDVGCGQAAKVCNNMLLAISMIGTAEVMNLGGRLGLQSKALTDIINMSSGRCWSCEEYNPCPGVLKNVPASKEYEGGFSTHLMAKDLALAQNKATATRSSIPLGSVAHQLYNGMCKAGYSKLDFSSIYKFLREL